MKYALLLSAAIATAPLLALGTAPPTVAQTRTPMQTVTGDRWSFSVPADWLATNYPQPGIGSVSLVAQYESPDGEVFVNMVTEPFPGDAQTYLQLNLQTMESFGFTIHGQQPTQVGGLPGAEVESSVPSSPPARVLQRFALTNATGYVLTCRTLEADFATYRDRCSSILESFTVLP